MILYGFFPALILAVTLGVLLGPGESRSAPADDDRRVIILGFDGVDPDRVTEYMAAGHLPNLKRLAEQGTFGPLATTNPAESPVSWASFSIGANPGKTNIYDFLHRREGTYIPEIALAKESGWKISNTKRIIASLGVATVLGALPLLVGALVGILYRGKTQRRLPRWFLWSPALVLFVTSAISMSYVTLVEIPEEIPVPELARKGTPFWQTAGEQDCTCCIIQVPVSFPAVGFPGGRIMSGLGTPDVRKTWGTFTIYGSKFPEKFHDPVNVIPERLELVGTAKSVTGGELVHLEFPEGDQVEVETEIYGPRNFTLTPEELDDVNAKPYVRPKLTIKLDRTQDTATFELENGATVSAKAGEWTDWLVVDFELSWIFKLKGIIRFCVRSVGPDFYAYASPVNFHPAAPPLNVSLSAPFSFSREVTERTSQWHETVGWAIATNPLKDELINEDEFLQDMEFSFQRRWKIIEKELEREDWRIFTGVLLFTDRVQHMFMRYIDPQHPLHEPDAPERYKNAILNAHKEMDRVVGEVMARYAQDGRTDLWIISDHGFSSFRKGFHINSWLIDQGFQTLRDPSQRDRGNLNNIFKGLPFSHIDWSQTTAYSMGLGKIYLNRRGREPEGVVETDAEADEIMKRIRESLLAYRDPDTGEPVVKEVYDARDLYQGPYVDESADLVIGFHDGYRVSWDTAAGNAPPGILEVNNNKWSGDHCSVDPSLVPGFVVSNRKIAIPDPSIIDMARTVLLSIGATPPPEMEGRNLVP